MNVGEVSAEVAIRAECREDFKRQSERLFDQLTYLRTTLYLLKEVAGFPIWVLSWDHQIFLRITASSFYDSVILAVTRLVADDSDDVVTLLRFRNAVGEMLVPEAVSSFRERLKVTKFDTATRDLANRVRQLRNTRVAHSSTREIPSNVSIDELEQLVAAVEKLYEPLLFRASAWFLPIDYVAEVRAVNAPVNTDIEEVLDGFARRRQNGVTRSLAYIRGLHHEVVSAEPHTGGAGHEEWYQLDRDRRLGGQVDDRAICRRRGSAGA